MPYGASLGKAMAENLGKIEPGTWKAINDHLVRWAQARGLEKGQRIRVDATAVQTNVHYPLDSELLYDGIRVVTRWLGRLRDWEGIGFVDHTRRAKRRVLSATAAARSAWTVPRSDSGVQDGPLCRAGTGRVGAVERFPQSGRGGATPTIWSCCTKSSSSRVAAQEKICSLFEEHTDIIKKSPRETVFGHKVFVSTGASSLILGQRTGGAGCGLFQKVWLDGRMVRSSWVYKQLKRFRAGIEGCIGAHLRAAPRRLARGVTTDIIKGYHCFSC